MNHARRLSMTAILLAALAVPAAEATPISAEASDNATVQPAGPRSGSSGKNFFNVEGSANGSFASYGVADFAFGAQPYTVIGINAASLDLTQNNAAFSAAGNVVLSLDQKASLSDIQPGGSSPLAFDGADPGTATDVGQGDLDLLTLGAGPFAYAVVANGHVDSYALTISPAVEAELISRLNATGTIRIVLGTADAGVAATWAGFSNSTYAGPTLNLDVEYDTSVPAEASTWGKIKATYR